MSDPNDYTVGWISAIEIEYAAAQEFLDDDHPGPKWVHRNDENHYKLGRIGQHNVVIAVLPRGDNGVAAAALVAKDMMHTFPNIRTWLMVGIGGGAPSRRHDIRLGDVVVSVPSYSEKGHVQSGVIQYDYGRTIQERSFQGARYLNRPPKTLLSAVTGLSAEYRRKGNGIDITIKDILQRNQRLQREYGRPSPNSDRLYLSDSAQTPNTLIERPARSDEEDNPAVHYGLIASADGFMEDAHIRDILAEELDVLCFEMEAAGLMNSFPCLVIRGICDYSDRHWSKEWRGYAAMSAAAYAKALLNILPTSEANRIEDALPPSIFERARSFITPLWGGKKEAVPMPTIVDPEEVQATDRSEDESSQIHPDEPDVTQWLGSGSFDSEESESEDQSPQMLLNKPIAMQSRPTTDANPEETQTANKAKYQSYQPPTAQSDATWEQTEIKHVYIAVMGVTGAGKSSLTSLCSGKHVKIGHNLKSCTADVEDIEFMLNNYVCVHLIDTPGFDDTNRSDVEVLQNIAVWLSGSLKQGTKLSGIIYLHRIIDVRMTGSALRNLSMFKKLCGEDAYSSVVLATTMWSQIDEATGAKRERELIETKSFWGYMHDKGSRLFRPEWTRESCLEIIIYILSLNSTTLLKLQDEIVNQDRQIEDTEAGVQLHEDLLRERKKHEAELLELKQQMEEAQQDAELHRALKEEYQLLKESLRRSDEEQSKLKQNMKEVQERKDQELLKLKSDRKKYKTKAKKYKEKVRHLENRSFWSGGWS